MRIQLIQVCVLALGVGCSNPTDESANVLPEAGVDASGDAAVLADAGGGGETGYPAAFRFDCINISKLGEPDGNGNPPIQARQLNQLWSGDIVDFRLNILIAIESVDLDEGKAVLRIGSGVGASIDDQCYEPETFRGAHETVFSGGENRYSAIAQESFDDPCVEAAAGGEALGTAMLEQPVEVPIFIYAENDKRVTFNCTADPELPDAVPLRAVRAEVTITPDGNRLAGQLKACLTTADISPLCSCLGDCRAEDPSDVLESGPCAGCPKGGIPLGTLLTGLRPTADCLDRTGGEGFELIATFHASRMAGTPVLCE